MATLRHLGFGKYAVIGDGNAVLHPGPMTKDEAKQWIADRPVAMWAAAKRAAMTDREYQRWLDQCIDKPINEEAAEIQAILAKRRDEDEVQILMRIIGPALKAGKQATRRERRMVRPLARQPQPAAGSVSAAGPSGTGV